MRVGVGFESEVGSGFVNVIVAAVAGYVDVGAVVGLEAEVAPVAEAEAEVLFAAVDDVGQSESVEDEERLRLVDVARETEQDGCSHPKGEAWDEGTGMVVEERAGCPDVVFEVGDEVWRR